MFFEESDQPRTDGSVGWASVYHAERRELLRPDHTQGLKITEKYVLPL